LRYADVEMDVGRYKVRRNGCSLNLSTMQFKLLRYLMENPTIVFSRQQLLADVWHMEGVEEGAVSASIARLRRALNAHGGELIKSVLGVGYALDCEAPARDKRSTAFPITEESHMPHAAVTHDT
jgi:two-component system phosphate regulon response regulator PhoB